MRVCGEPISFIRVAYRNMNEELFTEEHGHFNIGYSTGRISPFCPARLVAPQGGVGPCENPQRATFQGSLFGPTILLAMSCSGAAG